jgi:hypothetical protein
MNEPTIDSLISGDGWGGLENIDKRLADHAKEARRKDDALAEQFRIVFTSPEGQRVLEHLVDITLRRSSIPVAVVAEQPLSFADMAPFVTFREGQNAIVGHILKMMKSSTKVDGR